MRLTVLGFAFLLLGIAITIYFAFYVPMWITIGWMPVLNPLWFWKDLAIKIGIALSVVGTLTVVASVLRK